MRTLLFSFLLAGCAAAPAKIVQSSPPLPAVARAIDIELTDTSASGSRTTRYTLAIVDDRGWSKVSTKAADERLQVKARSDRYRNEWPAIVSVELERDLQGQPAVFLEQQAIFFAGRRTVLGHLERAGGTTEVTMVTR